MKRVNHIYTYSTINLHQTQSLLSSNEASWQVGISKFVIESDSKTLVDMLLRKDRAAKDTLTIVKRIERLLASDW